MNNAGGKPMASFDDFWVKLSLEIVELAVYDWRDYRDAAISDGMDFLDEAKDDIRIWCKMLEEGTLSQSDFAALLAGKKDLTGLVALKQRGLSRAVLSRFMNGLIDTVASTAGNFFCIG